MADDKIEIIEQPVQSQLYLFGDRPVHADYPPEAHAYLPQNLFLSGFRSREDFIETHSRDLGALARVLSNPNTYWSSLFRKGEHVFRWDARLNYRLESPTDWKIIVDHGEIRGPPYHFLNGYESPPLLINPNVSERFSPGVYFRFSGEFGLDDNHWKVKRDEESEVIGKTPNLLSMEDLDQLHELFQFRSFRWFDKDVKRGLRALV